MEIITKQIDKDGYAKILEYIFKFFKTKSLNEVVVSYGWDCNTEDLYVDKPLKIDELNDYIDYSVNKKIFKLGESDFYISSENKDFEFMLCHESDVHFSAKNIDFLNEVKKNWKKIGFDFYDARNVRN